MATSAVESGTAHSPPPNKLRRTTASPTISSARVQKLASSSQQPADSAPDTVQDAVPSSPSESPSPPPSDLEDAPSQKRVSYYVQAMDELIESVLKHEAFLFSARELHALRRLQVLEYQARYLFIRLYLRKDQWIRLQNIGYENDIEDLQAACEALWQTIIFTPEDENVKPELDLKPGIALNSSSRALPIPVPVPVAAHSPGYIDLTADSDEEDDKPEPRTVEQEEEELEPDLTRLAYGRDDLLQADPSIVMGLLSLEELVTLGKKMKVNPGKGSRKEWTQGLLKTSSQATLSFFASSKSKGKGKENADVKPLGAFGVGYDAKGNKLKASSVASSHALKVIGPVIRMSPAYRTLFDRLSLVFHRTSYTAGSTTTSFTSSLLARFGKRRFPDYVVSRTFAIFPSRPLLKQYEKALEVERRIEEILGEVGWEKLPAGAPRRIKTAEEKKAEKDAMCRDGIALFLSIEKSWEVLCKGAEKEMKLEEDDEEKRLLYYRRRFHPGWPLTRVVSKATGIYAKLDQHDREVQLLRALLAQTSFHRGKRGAWYDRLALVMMRYPLGDENSPTITEKRREKLARKRKQDALELCLRALDDPATHLIYRSSLQRRVTRIESSLDIPKDDRRVFTELLKKSESRVMEGERLDDPTIGKKSIWQARDGSEVSVEELALEQYTKEGWKGFHSENGILTTIFALCFWDVIFAPVDGVFETAYQSAPLDLRTDAFAVVRRPLVDARLEAIRRGEAGQILAEADDRERPRETWAVGVSWSKFTKEDLLEIVECIGGDALATILTMFVEEYGERTGGIPDLCLWNPTKSICKFSEVKGPGDSLSETQKVWIDVLLGAGVDVEVCKVMTHEDKDALDEKLAKAAAGAGVKGGRRKRAKTSGADSDEEDY